MKPTPKTELVKRALANRPAPQQKTLAQLDAERRKAEAASKRPPKPPPAPRKPNWRSARARDERAARRGRAPIGYWVEAYWDGLRWNGVATVQTANEATVYTQTHSADGLFRLMEELDVKFWEWFAQAQPDVRAALRFAESPPAPEPAGGHPAAPSGGTAGPPPGAPR